MEGEEYDIFREKVMKYLESRNISATKLLGLETTEPEVQAHMHCPFAVGDVVKARDGGMMFEGVVVNISGGLVDVDFGDAVESVRVENCSLVMSGLEFEVGDKVEYTPPHTLLHFLGTIIEINQELLIADVLMDGDDPDDVERGVPFDALRKVKTGRDLTEKFKRGIKLVQTINKFKLLGGK